MSQGSLKSVDLTSVIFSHMQSPTKIHTLLLNKWAINQRFYKKNCLFYIEINNIAKLKQIFPTLTTIIRSLYFYFMI